jgi:hypothetical protein
MQAAKEKRRLDPKGIVKLKLKLYDVMRSETANNSAGSLTHFLT